MTDSSQNIFIDRTEFLPFFKPDVGEDEISAVTEVLRSGWLTYGPKVREFGQACGEYLGVPSAVPVASCSAGLFLTLKAVGVGKGDEVVLPAMTSLPPRRPSSTAVRDRSWRTWIPTIWGWIPRPSPGRSHRAPRPSFRSTWRGTPAGSRKSSPSPTSTASR